MENVLKKGTRFAQGSIMYEASVANVAGKDRPVAGSSGPHDDPANLLLLGVSMPWARPSSRSQPARANLPWRVEASARFRITPMLGFNAAELSPAMTNPPSHACRPFDLWRTTGFSGKEPASLCSEAENSPRPALAWITGFGFANDSDGQTAMGLVDAIKFALANAMRTPGRGGLHQCLGNGTPFHHDANESAALQKVYGHHLAGITRFPSIKGAIGTALGASGPHPNREHGAELGQRRAAANRQLGNPRSRLSPELVQPAPPRAGKCCGG